MKGFEKSQDNIRKDGKQGYFRDPSPPNKEVYLHKIDYRIPE